MSMIEDMENNKDLVRRFCDLFYNQKDFVAAEVLMDEGIVNHHEGAVGSGRKVMIENFGMEVQDRSPGLHFELRRMVAEEDMVWTQALVTGLGEGGSSIAVDIWRVKHGKLAEHWTVEQMLKPGVDVSGLL